MNLADMIMQALNLGFIIGCIGGAIYVGIKLYPYYKRALDKSLQKTKKQQEVNNESTRTNR